MSSDISTHIPLSLRDAVVGRQVGFSVPYFHSYTSLPFLSVEEEKVVVCHLYTVNSVLFCFLIHFWLRTKMAAVENGAPFLDCGSLKSRTV